MKMRLKIAMTLTSIMALMLGMYGIPQARAVVPGINSLVSVNNTGDGQGGNGASSPNPARMSVSANGRYVVFDSAASNLVSGDTNGKTDIFVRDLVSGTTARINISTAGVQANGSVTSTAKQHAISSTGRYVVFASEATNLIDGQTITSPQVYIRDMLLSTTKVVTQKSDGTLGRYVSGIGGVSNDGRFVSWFGGSNPSLGAIGESTLVSSGTGHVYIADLKDRTFRQVNEPTIGTTNQMLGRVGEMSCDGSLMLFDTSAKIDPADTDDAQDVYMVDIRNGYNRTSITSMSNSTKQANSASISCNGEFITFSSDDLSFSPLLSVSTNAHHHFLYDRILDKIMLVDTSTSGVVSNQVSSAANVAASATDDKGNVAFFSIGTNLIDGTTIPATNIQLYLKSKATGVTEVLSRSTTSAWSNGAVGIPSISADGKVVSYLSPNIPTQPTNILTSDTNGYRDVLISQTGL